MKYDFDLENRKEATKKLIIKIVITVIEIIAVIFAGFVITHLGMVTYTVSSQTMSPTLKNGDKILVNKMSYRIHSIKRNDVVVVEQAGSEHNYYTAVRVIGLPGEKIQIQDGKVYIDDKELEEKYDFPNMENGGLALEKFTLDEDEYFTLCDNRNNGEDSRNASVGNILKENIIGKAWIRMNSIEFVSRIDAFSKDASSSQATSE